MHLLEFNSTSNATLLNCAQTKFTKNIIRGVSKKSTCENFLGKAIPYFCTSIYAMLKNSLSHIAKSYKLVCRTVCTKKKNRLKFFFLFLISLKLF